MYRPSLAGFHPPLDRTALSPKALAAVENLRQTFIKAVLIAEAHGRAVDSLTDAGFGDGADDLTYAMLAPGTYVEIFVDYLREFAVRLDELANSDGADFAARSWIRAFETAFPRLSGEDHQVPAQDTPRLGSGNVSAWSLDIGIDDRAIKRLETIMTGVLDSLPKEPAA